MPKKPHVEAHDGPAGGRGSVKSVESILLQEGVLASGDATLLKQNKPGGYACVSCAWAEPAKQRLFEHCENGAKATA